MSKVSRGRITQATADAIPPLVASRSADVPYGATETFGTTPPWLAELEALREVLRDADLPGPADRGADLTPEVERVIERASARRAAEWERSRSGTRPADRLAERVAGCVSRLLAAA